MNAKSKDSANEADKVDTVDPETGEIGGGRAEPAATGEHDGGTGTQAEEGRSGGKAAGKRSNANTKKSPGAGEPERIVTLTLASIDPARRPNPSTVCEVCPAAVWMATPRDVKCFCRLMHYWSWETSKPNELTHCDGLAIASEKED